MTLATNTPVTISHHDFQAMFDFAQNIYALKNNESYLRIVDSDLPVTAHVLSQTPSLLMGYDFHLTENGPKLIEINNNAGGLFEKDDGWIPQCQVPEMQGSVEERIAQMFPQHWQHIAIMDEDISEQYMYPEMRAYAALLEKEGRKISLVSPSDIVLKGTDLFVNNLRLDAIYNRHTDFYLESESMQHIRQSFLAEKIELNPYPRSYALVGDKNRMVDWWRQGVLDNLLNDEALEKIRAIVPETHLLSEYHQDDAWATRKSWVFKPAARHGGKGVLLGKAMSKKRFLALEANATVMQQLVPPSTIDVGGVIFKFDIRLYMHGSMLVAMAGRAWRGQITNFREEGSGWTAIKVER